MSNDKLKLTGVASLMCERLGDEDKRLIFTDRKLYVYRDGAWDIVDAESEENNWFHHAMYRACEDCGVEYGKSVVPLIKTIEAYCTVSGVEMDKLPYIACPNGSIDLDSEDDDGMPELVAWSPDHYTTRRAGIEYDPSATCPAWEAMLLRMLEDPHRTQQDIQSMAQFLQEWTGINIVGALAKRNRELKKGLILVGPTRTGKSTFAEVVTELYGKANIISPDLGELGTEFGKSMLLNVQAVISDDAIEEGTVANPKLVKAMITQDAMTVNRKFQSHITIRFGGGVLFTTNHLPQIPDTTDAVYERLVVVQFFRQFTRKDQKRDLRGLAPLTLLKKDKEFPGILNWALRGFIAASDRGEFSIPKELVEAKSLFRARNDPIYSFLIECTETQPRIALPAPVITAVCAEFAADQHLQTRTSMKVISQALQKTVSDVHPDVVIETQGKARTVQSYGGVGLNQLGLAFWERTREKGHAILSDYKSPHVRLT